MVRTDGLSVNRIGCLRCDGHRFHMAKHGHSRLQSQIALLLHNPQKQQRHSLPVLTATKRHHAPSAHRTTPYKHHPPLPNIAIHLINIRTTDSSSQKDISGRPRGHWRTTVAVVRQPQNKCLLNKYFGPMVNTSRQTGPPPSDRRIL